MTEAAPMSFEEFTREARADPAVVGLVLIGSQAHDGLVTEHSDHDLWVVLADGATSDLQRLHGHRDAQLDLVVISLSQFRAAGMPGFARYAVARGRVVLDRLDGEIAAIIAAKQRLGEQEAHDLAAGRLDDYVNLLYRSLKNHRDGHRLASRLDAADSLGSALDLLFAMDRRPRPYNKYLEWELAEYPLPGWDTEALLETVGAVVATGDPVPQRRLFAQIEAKARAFGIGSVLDAWGEDLAPLHPATAEE
ncbi:hypothetical protein K3N28_20090 [Glycomyces sp. TRM65418]|uniref:hypothetical protein n=1 Tax=Glycomyces sp. TRM65418 TaxID=2867006 RepID=UPI001CE5EFC3|nr:hypothetical protein [Glycomyces sp. TRM65418]MCC3765366.1 hypothetical protein [Glycomyces sp. TRM65418]QZD54983.1 hypothetical protein K3N28_19995 [Glycomyces sp. TRM65418]